MIDTSLDLWAEEIRDYLLGRLSKNRRAVELKAWRQSRLVQAPIRRWWIFEGKEYSPFRGALFSNWPWIARNALRLMGMFSPRLRVSERIDGPVDWGHTLARGPQRVRPEYVIQSSGIGLDEPELECLAGWMRWVADEWRLYAEHVRMDGKVHWPDFPNADPGSITDEQLHRWARTARRSRWPLLRDVIAESLRPTFEPEELDRIPLPLDGATLFELLTLVRVLRHFDPKPQDIRWLSSENDNMIRANEVNVYYQQSIDRDRILADYADEALSTSAVDVFNLRIPRRIDLAVDFERTRAGFDGIIIEVKSGGQQFDSTVAQLRTYRAARERVPDSRYIIWGIVEQPDEPDLPLAELQRYVVAEAARAADVWIFSSADNIPKILDAVLSDTR